MEDLFREVKQLETLVDAMQTAESGLAELLNAGSCGARSVHPESGHITMDQVQGLLNRTEEMRSRIARLESSLDTLESALASIELLRSDNGPH